MKDSYKKPVVLLNEELAEGVYAASGSVAQGGDCYEVTGYIHQTQETGRHDYRIQINAHHKNTAGHTTDNEVLVISFNKPVSYKAGGNGCVGGNGTTTIRVQYNHHNNPNDNIGVGDLIVEADEGLAITGMYMICNHN